MSILGQNETWLLVWFKDDQISRKVMMQSEQKPLQVLSQSIAQKGENYNLDMNEVRE